MVVSSYQRCERPAAAPEAGACWAVVVSPPVMDPSSGCWGSNFLGIRRGRGYSPEKSVLKCGGLLMFWRFVQRGGECGLARLDESEGQDGVLRWACMYSGGCGGAGFVLVLFNGHSR